MDYSFLSFLKEPFQIRPQKMTLWLEIDAFFNRLTSALFIFK